MHSVNNLAHVWVHTQVQEYADVLVAPVIAEVFDKDGEKHTVVYWVTILRTKIVYSFLAHLRYFLDSLKDRDDSQKLFTMWNEVRFVVWVCVCVCVCVLVN